MMKSVLNHNRNRIIQFVGDLFSPNFHKKRLVSVSNAVLGILAGGSLRISTLGRGLAQHNGLRQKHAIKQVDRLLSNEKLNIEEGQAAITKLLLAKHSEFVLAMDWTSFAKDNQITLTLRHVTSHGRAIPLLWLTVSTHELKGRKIEYENVLLSRLRSLVPEEVKIVLLADREFGSVERFERLKKRYNMSYVIRFRANTTVFNTDGKSQPAKSWLSKYRRCVSFENGLITLKQYSVKKILICKDKGMKDIWCIACSDNFSIKKIKRYYAKRWGTESSYRDEKDISFGLGLSKSRIKSPQRRDRLLLLSAIAIILLTIMGKAAENIGYDKTIRANTVTKYRTHALFSLGVQVYAMMPTMTDKLFRLFWKITNKIMRQSFDFKAIFSVI